MKGYALITVCVLLTTCHVIQGAPNQRFKRDTDEQALEDNLNPIESEDAGGKGLDREKRKLPEAKFDAKNAVLGFVFGKINSLIDTKTKFIDNLDKQNIEKNKQYHIESPKPIHSFQDLISAVITPKITAITGTIGSLSGSFLGSSGGGNGDSSGGSNGGLGNIVSSLLKLSGPILTSSSGAGANSGSSSSNSVSSDEADDDFN